MSNGVLALTRAAHRYRAVPFYAGLAAAALVALLAVLAPAPAQAARLPPPAPEALEAGPFAVLSSFRGRSSELSVIALHRTARPRRIATVEHAEGYGLRAAVVPAGRHIAYLRVPPSAVDPAQEAELWTLDADGAGLRRLAAGLDGAGAPVWSPDGQRVAVRRAAPEAGDRIAYSLVVVDTVTGAAGVVAAPAGDVSLHAFGWTSDGKAVLAAAIGPAGTEVLAFPVHGAAPQPLFHASDGIARDFRLDPSGRRLLFNEVLSGHPEHFRLNVADLEAATVQLFERSALPLLNPTWRVDGAGFLAGSAPQHATLVGGLADFRVEPGATRVALAPPGHGFLAPLSWSPGGRWLAVQVFTGPALNRVTAVGLAVWDPAVGALRALNTGPAAEFVGWAHGD